MIPVEQKAAESLDRAIQTVEALLVDAGNECASAMPNDGRAPGIRYRVLSDRCDAIEAVLVQLQAIRDNDRSRFAEYRAKAEAMIEGCDA